MRITLYIFLILTLITSYSWCDDSRNIEFESRFRVGYDDNLDNNPDNDPNKVSSFYVSELINLTGKITPSGNQDILYFFQPEAKHRFDAEDKLLYLQDFYLNYINILSPITQFQLTERFRIAEPDRAQIDGKSFAENDLKSSYRRQIDRKHDVYLYLQNVMRKYENNINTAIATKDFIRYNGAIIFNKLLDRKKSINSGFSFSDHNISDNAGGMKSATLFGGYDHTINPRLMTSIQAGYTKAEIEELNNRGSNDSSSPFFEIGMDYELSDQTKMNLSYSYSLRYSTLASYNAELRSDWLLAIRHEFTPKIDVAASFSYIFNTYEVDYRRNTGSSELLFEEDTSKSINVRALYQINRNHAAEIGYQWRSRDNGFLDQEYDRNKFYLGWKYNI